MTQSTPNPIAPTNSASCPPSDADGIVSVKREISPAKLAANRANALKSTGPRTPEGKRKVSLNPLKHGGRAAFSSILPCECSATYATHRQELRSLFRPKTAFQNFLVERIVAIVWKLVRIQEAEQHLYELEATRAVLPDDPGDDRVELSPGEVLARRMSDNPQNGFLLLHRYEQALCRELHALVRRYQTVQKVWPEHPCTEDEEAQARADQARRDREVDAWIARCAEQANSLAMASKPEPKSLPATGDADDL